MKIKETLSRVSPFPVSLAFLTIPLLTPSCGRSADYADDKDDANATDDSTALMPSSDLRIPFFGLREYSGVAWRAGWRM